VSAPKVIQPAAGALMGELRMPGDKSVAHRAVLFNSVAEGTAFVTGLPDGEDVRSTVHAMRALGCEITDVGRGRIRISGCGLALRQPSEAIDCGNSGTTMRLLMGLLAGNAINAELTGDASLNRRPMERVAAPLRELGAHIETNDGKPPVLVGGKSLSGRTVRSGVASAQVKTALLLAGMQANGETVVIEPEATRDHSERMLRAMGVALTSSSDVVSVVGPCCPRALDVDVCGDVSSAAFFAVAATLVEGSEVMIRDVCTNPTRMGFVSVLKRMGADISLFNSRESGGEPVADLRVRSASLSSTEIAGSEIPACIDELPILAVAASRAEGVTRIRDAAELRVKESDRIAAMASLLAAVGVGIEEHADGLSITGGPLAGGATIDAAGDHRIAMSAAVAGLVSKSPVAIKGAEAVAVSFPSFFDMLELLQGRS
jgi:3-phosphoshikimate 1-carboxyvinyltransferase